MRCLGFQKKINAFNDDLVFAWGLNMPRSKAILQSDYPYSITARCINREWFNISMNRVWDIFCDELTHVNQVYNMNIHSFVLMSNHFHLITSTPEANMSQAMQQFMHRSSRALTKEGNRINHEDPKGILKWLNTTPDPNKLEAVQWGLKRPYFKSKKSAITNRPVLESTDTL